MTASAKWLLGCVCSLIEAIFFCSNRLCQHSQQEPVLLYFQPVPVGWSFTLFPVFSSAWSALPWLCAVSSLTTSHSGRLPENICSNCIGITQIQDVTVFSWIGCGCLLLHPQDLVFDSQMSQQMSEWRGRMTSVAPRPPQDYETTGLLLWPASRACPHSFHIRSIN